MLGWQVNSCLAWGIKFY